MHRRQFLQTATLSSLGIGCRPSPSKEEALFWQHLTASWLGEALPPHHPFSSPPLATTPQRIIRTPCLIAGGGVAGLSAAYALRLHGWDDFVVLDGHLTAGGNARSDTRIWQGQHLTHPLGAHYLPQPQPHQHHVHALLEAMGLVKRQHGVWHWNEQHQCYAPQERLYLHGIWQHGLLPVVDVGASTHAQYQQFETLINQWQRTRAFAIPQSQATIHPDAEALRTITFYEYLMKQGLTNLYLHWYLDYCCRDDYGDGLHAVSAFAGIHYFASRHGFRAPFGDHKDELHPVLTWSQGNAYLTEWLHQPLGTRWVGGTWIQRIEQHKHTIQIDVYQTTTKETIRYITSRLILALPVHVLARIWVSPPDFVLEAAQNLRHAAWAVTQCLVAPVLNHGVGPASTMAWDNVLFPDPSTLSSWGQGLGYVHAQHQQLAPSFEAQILTYYHALGCSLTSKRNLLKADPTSLAKAFITPLLIPHPDLMHKLQAVFLTRYGHAMPCPVPYNHGWQPRAYPLRTAHTHLVMAHSDWAGYSIFEEAYEQGQQAAAQLLRRKT